MEEKDQMEENVAKDAAVTFIFFQVATGHPSFLTLYSREYGGEGRGCTLRRRVTNLWRLC